MTQFEQAVDQVIEDSERLHKVVNGTASETVVTEDGSTIPTVRKALLDNLFFKTPPMPWIAGTQTTVFNQLYAFNGTNGVQWWYAPTATANAPVVLPQNPANSVNWRMYNDAAAMASIYAPINSPILTGNPQAPTPAANSNSTTIATTAFVTTAIASALSSISGGSVTFANLSVTGATTLNSLIVNGTTELNGPVNADNSTGRFQELILTKELSSLTFVFTDADNPTFFKTRLDPYAIQTHSIQTDIIVNGTVAEDDTTMSLTGVGNNVFDYVYIRGNASKDPTAPRLKVSGTTEVENLNITGNVTGITFSVDGLDISPNSVTTADGVTVGGDLQVSGVTNLGNATIGGLDVTNNLTVGGDTTLESLLADSAIVAGAVTINGLTVLNGGFTTGSGTGRVGGTFTVDGSTTLGDGLNVTGETVLDGNLTVTGDVDLNGSTGTTTVNNLVIKGSVSGLSVDLTGQNINVGSLSSTGAVTANSLTVQDTALLTKASVEFLTLIAEDIDSSTADWTPSGDSNVYNVTVDADLTIGAWPDPTDAFSAVIYLTQDGTGGHTVTLDPNYLVLNSETINETAGSVTILQLTYNGVEGGVIDTVIVRRP
uniref:Tail fiber protein n=1 Tax=Salmonella phage vB_SEnST11_KE22 TaxID=3161173 RepID=A0AAU8GIE1_9CAUD